MNAGVVDELLLSVAPTFLAGKRLFDGIDPNAVGLEIIEVLDEVRHWATRIGGRYMGLDRAEEYGARNGVPGELLVRLRPQRVVGLADLSA